MVKIKTLIGSLLVLLVLGSVYAWSLFNLPLSNKYNLDISAVAFTFGIMTLFLAIGSSSSGFLKLRIGMQNVVALSAVCTGLGLLIAAFAPNLLVLYLSAGVLLGFGDGLGYMLVLTNCVKFFPKHKGLISALCIGAYGLGSLVFKSIDSYLLSNYSLENALLTWGVLSAVITTLGCILIYDAMQQDSVLSSNTSKREYDLHSAVRTVPYWLLTIMFFIDCMVGLYIIGVASNLGTELLNLSLQEAAFAVSVIALANIAGRLIMGVLSDKLPRIRLITFDQTLSLIAMVILLVLPLNSLLFFTALGLVAFSFGGTLTIYPSIISDFFGIKNLAKNYGLLYLGFGLGSLFGYSFAYLFGSYTITFTMMAALLALAIVLSLMVKFPAEFNESHSLAKQELRKKEAQAKEDKAPASELKVAPKLEQEQNVEPKEPADEQTQAPKSEQDSDQKQEDQANTQEIKEQALAQEQDLKSKIKAESSANLEAKESKEEDLKPKTSVQAGVFKDAINSTLYTKDNISTALKPKKEEAKPTNQAPSFRF